MITLNTKQTKAMRAIMQALDVDRFTIRSNPSSRALGCYTCRILPTMPNKLWITGRPVSHVRTYHGQRVILDSNPVYTFIHETTHRLQHIHGAMYTAAPPAIEYAYNEIIADTVAASIINTAEAWRETACYINIYAPHVPPLMLVNVKQDVNFYRMKIVELIQKTGLTW